MAGRDPVEETPQGGRALRWPVAALPLAVAGGLTALTLVLARSPSWPILFLILLAGWAAAAGLGLFLAERERRRAAEIYCRVLEAEVAERALAEERYRLLFERNPAGMYRSTIDGRLLDCNEAFIRMFGYPSRDSMVSMPVGDLYADPADREWLLARFLDDHAPQNVEVRFRRRNGEEFWGLLRGPGGSPSRARDGSTLIEGTILDISDRRRAEEGLRDRERELVLLSELGSLLQTCDSVDEAHAVIARQGRRLFPQHAGAVYLISPSRTDLDVAASWGEGGEPIPAADRFRPEDCWALRVGRESFFADPVDDLRCRHLAGAEPVASLCVPLVALGETLGVLHLREPAPGARLKNRRQLAATVAEQLAMAIANLNLRETLRNQSIRDSLTGLYNRRYFQESLEREIRRVKRKGTSLGVIMLDLDRFKLFNDNFGHEAGDLLLRTLSELLHRKVRGEDVPCRYGGEEFALILPEASLEAICARAEELRQAVKELAPVFHDSVLGGVTVSVGVAVYPDHGPTGDDVVRAADTALYHSKACGRDRISVAPASPLDRRLMIPE
ncbi:MAG TPA: diguanylate cyclase [Thermoanaerobaculia bacterium]|nr:diguanylate cyclase [Thermoanaerobaculia bacterium]